MKMKYVQTTVQMGNHHFIQVLMEVQIHKILIFIVINPEAIPIGLIKLFDV